MNRALRALIASAVGAAAFALPTTAKAVDTTLNTLITGGANAATGITLGDKHYYDFTFSSSGDAPVAAGAVGVSLTNDAAGNHYQLRFNFSQDILDASAGQTTDVVISYKVDVLGAQLINRVGLAFDGNVNPDAGDASASVTETVRTVDGSPLASGSDNDTAILDVFNDGTGGLPDDNDATLAVIPTRSLEFTKDIIVSSRPGGGRVTITTVDNFVDQVPEPGSVALLAAAGGMLLARRRRA